MEDAVDMPRDEKEISHEDEPQQESKGVETDDQQSERETYLAQFRRELESMSIRGLSRAFKDKKRKYQAYWTSVFVVGFVILCINLRNITVFYTSDPILTQLEREEQPFTWPHFTLCNPTNPIPFWNDPELNSTWRSVLTRAESNYSLPKYDFSRKKKIWEHYMGISTINPSQFYRNLVDASIYKMFVLPEDSYIAGYSSTIDLFKSVRDIQKVFDVRLYTIRSPIACITLVTERLKKVLQPKSRLLSIKLYVILDVKSYMNFNMGFESRKTYFYVTKPNSTILSALPYYIQPGTDNLYQIKQKIHSRVANCRKDSFKFGLYDIDMVTKWPFEGDFEDCRLFVSQKKFVDQCDCYNPYLPVYNLTDKDPILCTNMTKFDNVAMSKKIECLNNVLKNNSHSVVFQREINETCEEFLTYPPCTQSSYSVSGFTTTWTKTMSPTRKKEMKSRIHLLPNYHSDATEEFTRKNLAILHLEWGKEKTEATFEQFEYPLSRFMSDVGGLLVLWIGLNVFSIFEVLVIIYKFIKYKRAKKVIPKN